MTLEKKYKNRSWAGVISITPGHLSPVAPQPKIFLMSKRGKSRGKIAVSARYRHWVFTINNPNDADRLALKALIAMKHFKYCVYQEELGHSDTPHYQGYIEFKRTMRLSTVKRLLGGRVHLERRRGTQQQARDYCMKEDGRISAPVELGTYVPISGQGHRTDLATLTLAIKETPDVTTIAKAFPIQYLKFHKGITKLCRIYTPKRSSPPKVWLYYGTTGTGKTRDAFTLQDIHRKAPDTRWFDGYSNQKTLLLDDFCGRMSKMSLSYLLQLLDRYPMLVEVKGDYVPLLATQIIITTNIHPRLWYDYSDRIVQYNALARRIHKVMWYKEFEEKPVELTHKSFFHDFAEHCVLENIFKPAKPALVRQGGLMDLSTFTVETASDEDSYEFP